MEREQKMFNEDEELYKENILDHYKHPHNFKVVDPCTHSAKKRNNSCGDELTVYITIENNICTDIGFQGHGCAISQAAMSMLSDTIIGKTKKEIEELQTEDVLTLLGVQVAHARMKCATISLQTIHKALEE